MNLDYASNLVRHRVELAMVSTIQVLRGDIGVMDEVTLLVSGITNIVVIYEGKARLHNLTGSGVLSVGESQIDTRTVQITIPQEAPMPRRDDLVQVLIDSDANIAHGLFRVMDVNLGGLFNGFHSLSCQGWTPDRYWG